LQNVSHLEPVKEVRMRGAMLFAAGLFEAAKGQLVGAAFVVDSKVEDHYKDTVRGICETIRRAEDFAK